MITTEDLIRADYYRPATIFCAEYTAISVPALTSADLPFTLYSEEYGSIFEPAPGGLVRIKQRGLIGYSLRVEMQVAVAGYARYNLFSSSSELPLMAFSFPAIVNLLHQSGGIALMSAPGGVVDYSLRFTNFSSAVATVFSAELRMAYLGQPDV